MNRIFLALLLVGFLSYRIFKQRGGEIWEEVDKIVSPSEQKEEAFKQAKFEKSKQTAQKAVEDAPPRYFLAFFDIISPYKHNLNRKIRGCGRMRRQVKQKKRDLSAIIVRDGF